MKPEDQMRVDRWKFLRQEQKAKRVIVVQLPEWIARIRRFFARET